MTSWPERLSAWLPGFLAAHPVLSRFERCTTAILHGSLTMGVDDEFADIDFWLLLPAADLARLDALSPTRFFEFSLDGKAGHFNTTSIEQFTDDIRRCTMDAVYQLRRGVVLADATGIGRQLQTAVRRPMPAAVRRAFFMHHYVEMRSEHRACDSPMERQYPVAVLLSLPKAIGHALRAAMVLDGEAYPYDKWLYAAARNTPTGARIAPSVEKIIALLGAGGLGFPGPERENAISQELRVIRQVLKDAARAGGLDGPYLDPWWLCMDEPPRLMAAVRWPID